ncbi:ATP-dependent Clp protease proteolytic subunit [Candidatus Vidania fulgoroideorum]
MIKNIIPYVSYKGGFTDIYTRLLKERIIFITGVIDDYLANSIVCQIIYLDNINNKDIQVYINSPGGSIYSGLAIYDVMKNSKSKISTICYGLAASMGAFLLSCGEKGRRFCTKNSRIMIHQPIGGIKGQAKDIKIHYKEIYYLKKKISKIFSNNTGKSVKKINKDIDRDNYMSPKKAKKYGIIDIIIS